MKDHRLSDLKNGWQNWKIDSIPKIMKYCNDCLTPIKSDSNEEYCAFCKRDRVLKEKSTA